MKFIGKVLWEVKGIIELIGAIILMLSLWSMVLFGWLFSIIAGVFYGFWHVIFFVFLWLVAIAIFKVLLLSHNFKI